MLLNKSLTRVHSQKDPRLHFGESYALSSNLSIMNSLQYDYDGWMPNTPITLQLPPPTTKGETSEATMLKTFPAINTTVHGMATVWLLSKQSSDFVSAQDFMKYYYINHVYVQVEKKRVTMSLRLDTLFEPQKEILLTTTVHYIANSLSSNISKQYFLNVSFIS